MLRISIDAAIAVSRRRLPGSVKPGTNRPALRSSGALSPASQIRDCLFTRTTRHTERGSDPIARNQNTYAKRQREMEKKQKAEDKRMRRSQRKAAADEPDAVQSHDVASMDADEFEKDTD